MAAAAASASAAAAPSSVSVVRDGPETLQIAPDSLCTRNYIASLGFDAVKLREEMITIAPWVSRENKSMLYRGNELKRRKFFLNRGPPVNDAGQPAVLFKYGYPGMTWFVGMILSSVFVCFFAAFC